MKLYKELDQMVREISVNDAEYDQNKAMISQHLCGELELKSLPENLKQVIFDWEIECVEYENFGIDRERDWDHYDGDDIEEWS